MMLLDPVISTLLVTTVSLILLTGAVVKWRDVANFESSVAGYRLLPEALVHPAAWGLLLLETVAGLALLVLQARPLSLVPALALMVLVTAAIAINLLRGRTDIDCGCGGTHTNISWSLVVRNALIMLTLLLASASGAERELTLFDSFTVVAGALALFGLYSAANQLMANHPQLISLRK